MSRNTPPKKWVEIMEKKEDEFNSGKLSASQLRILAKAFERESNCFYLAKLETIKNLRKLNFSDDSEHGSSRISQFCLRTKKEIEEIERFYSLIIFKDSWRGHHSEKEIKENKWEYIVKTINYVPSYNPEKKENLTIKGVGDKSIAVIDETGKKQFFWFNLPKYAVLSPKYKNTSGHGKDLARQIIAKYGDEKIKRKIGAYII